MAEQRRIDVIIPVYRGIDETRQCIDSVLSTETDQDLHIVLIDDASPEPEMDLLLAGYGRDSRVRIIRNDTNKGYAASVNIGIGATQNDIILLNSDTEVYPAWIDDIVQTAYSDPQIATVTPFSTNAGLFTLFDNDECDKYGYSALAAAVHDQRSSVQLYIPTGHGFCLYIKRSALSKVGLFNEVIFRRGYGEENDFCLRCSRRGFKHAVCTNALVRHVRSVSFGNRKRVMLSWLHYFYLTARYPSYPLKLRKWKNSAIWRKTVRELRERVIASIR